MRDRGDNLVRRKPGITLGRAKVKPRRISLANVFDVAGYAKINRRPRGPQERLVVMEAAVAVSIKCLANNRAEEIRVTIHIVIRTGGIKNRPQLRGTSAARTTRIGGDYLCLPGWRVDRVKLKVCCSAHIRRRCLRRGVTIVNVNARGTI